MVVIEFRCSMCGHRFEAEVLDREDPKEKNKLGMPLRCPKCNGVTLNELRTLRRVDRRAS